MSVFRKKNCVRTTRMISLEDFQKGTSPFGNGCIKNLGSCKVVKS